MMTVPSLSIEPNALFRCDCLSLLERLGEGCVTLAYVDPPWFTESSFARHGTDNPVTSHGEPKTLLEYLDFLARRLQEIYRVLASNGSLYFHVDPRISADARLILDQLFGRMNFLTEIIVPRRRFLPRGSAPPIQHESILVYSKTREYVYHPPMRPLAKDEIHQRYNLEDENGRFRLINLTVPLSVPSSAYVWNGVTPPEGRSWRYSIEKMAVLEAEGLIHYSPKSNQPLLKRYAKSPEEIEVGNIWDDLQLIPFGREKMDFPTQKPLDLVRRIVGMSTNEGDFVLDPFCGSGTGLVASQQMGRRWIGCEISEEAFAISAQRLEHTLGMVIGADFKLVGENDLVNIPIASNTAFSLIRGIEEVLESKRPVVYVEGKTDVAILTYAWKTLYKRQEMPFSVKDSNVLSADHDKSAAGASSLGKFISTVRPDSPHVAVAVLDRDWEGISEYKKLPKYFREEQDLDAKVADNMMAAALLLPVPPGKEPYAQFSNLCIEFYFGDEALATRSEEGLGLEMQYPETEIRLKSHGGAVIGNGTSDLRETRQIRGGKTVFAERIVPELPPREFAAFKPLFERILEVIAYLQAKTVEPPGAIE